MSIAILSYSYTGNNDALARSVAQALSAEHIRISENKPRTMGAMILDMVFNRTPQARPSPDIMSRYELILFFAPVWMGSVASPLRPYFSYLKSHPQKYGFVSISGGADGGNPKLNAELNKRAGAGPAVFKDLHIADLLPATPTPERKDTSAYRLNDQDLKHLTGIVAGAVQTVI